MKNNNIPPYILCPTPDLARQVLEKIERESDLRWKSTLEKPVDGFNSSTSLDDEYHYPVVLVVDGQRISWANIKYYKDKGITNFTKAEDFLEDEPKIISVKWYDGRTIVTRPDKIEFIKHKNNSMTNKTWDNLEVGDEIVDGPVKINILGVCGKVFFISQDRNYTAFAGCYTKEELIEKGYKIKGVSEEKPSLDRAIKLLEPLLLNHSVRMEEAEKISVAIEMLKKLK